MYISKVMIRNFRIFDYVGINSIIIGSNCGKGESFDATLLIVDNTKS